MHRIRLICCAALIIVWLVLWVRSYYIIDVVGYYSPKGLHSILTNPGSVWYMRTPPWGQQVTEFGYHTESMALHVATTAATPTPGTFAGFTFLPRPDRDGRVLLIAVPMWFPLLLFALFLGWRWSRNRSRGGKGFDVLPQASEQRLKQSGA
jgi:hypothetical protein